MKRLEAFWTFVPQLGQKVVSAWSCFPQTGHEGKDEMCTNHFVFSLFLKPSVAAKSFSFCSFDAQ